jgi:hypothetical protein
MIGHEGGLRPLCLLFPKDPLCFPEVFEERRAKRRVFLPVS